MGMIRLKNFLKSNIGFIVIFFLAAIGLGHVITWPISVVWHWFG